MNWRPIVLGKNAIEGLAHVGCVQCQRSFEIRKRSRSWKTHSSRYQRSWWLGLRHRVRLQSVLHLQSMFERAQEGVGLRQIGALLFRNEITIGKSSQTYQSVRHAQPFVASTMRQLQRLRDELNFPNAAALEFHI